VTGVLASLVADHPLAAGRALLVDDRRAATRAEVAAEIAVGTEALTAAGVGPGDAVAIAHGNRIEFVVAMFAIWRVGAVMVPVNIRAPARERERMLTAAGAGWIVDADGTRPTGVAATPQPAGTAFVTWTSGTTGAPKPIRHGHTEYLELLDRVLVPLRGAGGAEEGPPNLVPVALALNAGIYNVLFGLRAGRAVVILDGFEPARFAAIVAEHGITSTVLPPAAITMLNDAVLPDGLAPLRYVRSITAPLSPLAARRFTDRFGVTVLNGYGQAEIGEVIGWTAADARAHPEKVGAVGRPHPGVEIRVEAPDPVGIGRLWVRPPKLALADSGLDGRIDPDGYVDTGDLARVDPDGFVWIEGRTGDVINRGGNKVFPEAVEEVLRLHPAITDAAVVARADDRLGEVPVAFVVADTPIPDAEIAEHCRAHLVAYKVPVAFTRIPEIPRNDTGKILRRELAGR
jgi:long-chain acyl-CoA synthetase